MIDIRPLHPGEWPAVWQTIEPVFRQGETHTFSWDISEAQARRVWIEDPLETYVAVDAHGSILGTYYLKPNKPPGGGDHVCNCGYIVSEDARGQGIARRLCLHSQEEARAHGFRAMQYNFVVSTNTVAIRLWESLGFDIVGTLPGAFLHPTAGYVDAHIMFKSLDVEPAD